MSEHLPADARIFAVASGKGGVGKTTTAVNMGAALAESGAETVVVDADLGMANVADLLDHSISGPTLQDVLAGEIGVEEATYRGHEGLAVVPGTADLDSYAAVEPERLREVVDALRAEFEYVLLDAGAGLSHDSALPLGLADAVLVVTTPRETATRDAAKTRRLAERIDATVGGVVVTRVREEPSELDPDAVGDRVGAPVLATVPEDGAVREALAAGRPVVAHAPASQVTAAYHRLAATLAGREAVEPNAASGQPAAAGELAPESGEPAPGSGESAATAEPSPEPDDGDDPTSMAELLEREADRSADVSALTSEPAAGADESADDPPTLDLGSEAGSVDPLDAGPEPADPLEAGPEPSDDTGEAVPASDPEEDPLGESDDGGIGIETDGDILVAEETPLDGSESASDPEPASDSEPASDPEPTGEEADDPLADIPRFDDESSEEFTRGSEAADPLAADPADGIASTDEGGATDEVESDVGDEPVADDLIEEASDGDDPNADDASAQEETDDGVAAGPNVEIDEPDDSGGLLGRLAGLFR